MGFNDSSTLDSSRVQDQRGRGGKAGVAVGTGGGILVLLLSLFFGPGVLNGVLNPTAEQQTTSVQGTGGPSLDEKCKTGADADKFDDCRIVGALNSLDSYWAVEAAQLRLTSFVAPKATIFQGGVNTACGSASSAMGPFYCPGDSTIYIDPTFFNELTRNYGADSGALAQMYVVAHEYGHHMQNLTGAIQNSQVGSGSQGGSVRVELQADCFAGAWAQHASSTTDKYGQRLLEPLTQKDINSALSAAAAVGDDRIQQKATGRVNPEAWTHGSSAQREAWFMAGYSSGDPGRCDTFSARDLNNP